MHVHNMHSAVERKRILKAFRVAGAVAPEHARSLPQLGVEDNRFLRRLSRLQIVREVRSGEYYLDEDALREYDVTLLKWLAVPFALILMVMIWAIVRGR